jgi:tetratricopeptide (TPR) repeat protein
MGDSLVEGAARKIQPHSPQELETLSGLVRSVSSFTEMSVDDQDVLIASLLDYECYAQVCSLLSWRAQQGKRGVEGALADYCLLMRVYFEGLESFERFCSTAELAIRRLALSFSIVRLKMAEEILGLEQFELHAQFYQSVAEAISDRAQRVLLLTRLALILEKKLYREADAEPIYRTILELEPYNIKALRFLRLWYSQGGEWENVACQLRLLIKAYRNPHEKHRAAHELAQIQLYNLNNPEAALNVLLNDCRDSRLDTRQTLVEALERLGAFEELLGSLNDMEQATDQNEERSAINVKKGLVLMRLGERELAVRAFQESVRIAPENLLAHESLISSLIDIGAQVQVSEALLAMAQRVTLPDSRQKLKDLAASVGSLAANP